MLKRLHRIDARPELSTSAQDVCFRNKPQPTEQRWNEMLQAARAVTQITPFKKASKPLLNGHVTNLIILLITNLSIVIILCYN